MYKKPTTWKRSWTTSSISNDAAAAVVTVTTRLPPSRPIPYPKVNRLAFVTVSVAITPESFTPGFWSKIERVWTYPEKVTSP